MTGILKNCLWSLVVICFLINFFFFSEILVLVQRRVHTFRTLVFLILPNNPFFSSFVTLFALYAFLASPYLDIRGTS